MDRSRLNNTLLWSFALGMLGLFFYTVLLRLWYPYDLEWMEGGVLLHAHRVLEGKSLYPLPSDEYIPFIYPPLYYWFLAGVAWCSELDYPAGRSLSIVGTLLSVAALVRALRLEQVSWGIAVCGGAFFLSTYENTGAFLDIVRADGILLALMTWSMVWVREERIVWGALALALAFATKHNAAIMGVPIGLWLWHVRGWRVAARFALWSALPAILFVGVMQWVSEGRFLVYLLEVPAHHPFVLWRLTWLASFEIASALLLLSLVGLSCLLLHVYGRKTSSFRRYVGIVGIVVVMCMFLFSTHIQGFLSTISIEGLTQKQVGRNAMGIVFCFALLCVLYSIRMIRVSSSYGYWLVCGGIAWLFSGVMRAHHGGYSNVLLPGMWSYALLCGLFVHTLWERLPKRRSGLVILVGLQLYIAAWSPNTLIPTQEDVEAGDRLIARLREIEEPVFSPHAPWYPVKAGHPPSAHLIALWDIKHKGGPFTSSVQVIEFAMEQQKFGAVLLANQKEDYGRKRYYRRREILTYDSKSVFFPKKGWKVRPKYLYFPRKK